MDILESCNARLYRNAQERVKCGSDWVQEELPGLFVHTPESQAELSDS